MPEEKPLYAKDVMAKLLMRGWVKASTPNNSSIIGGLCLSGTSGTSASFVVSKSGRCSVYDSVENKSKYVGQDLQEAFQAAMELTEKYCDK